MKGSIIILFTICVMAMSCQKEPEACFEVRGEDHKVGITVVFENCSSNSSINRWDIDTQWLDDDQWWAKIEQIEDSAEPEIIFYVGGEYLVKLRVWDKDRKNLDSRTKTIQIQVPDIGQISGEWQAYRRIWVSRETGPWDDDSTVNWITDFSAGPVDSPGLITSVEIDETGRITYTTEWVNIGSKYVDTGFLVYSKDDNIRIRWIRPKDEYVEVYYKRL
ncbi:MAG: hypothetical protein IH946_06745 [Bacteroidetes bacterium]|nr:hypothetical protein [Bacteroidota bacterium]